MWFCYTSVSFLVGNLKLLHVCLAHLRENMEEAKEKLAVLLKKAQENKVNLKTIKSLKKYQKHFDLNFKWKVLMFVVILSAIYVKFSHLLDTKKCSVAMPRDWDKIFREPDDCSFCRGIRAGKRISNIDPDEFEKLYAYNGNVIIVTDATKNWTALDVFNFWYFKEIYEKYDPKKKTLDCQFFRYKTNFTSLFEALNMDEDRANYKPGTEPWYFGWSNCNEEIASILRQHYSRPYFLPKTSELNAVDWIFMGGRGYGAHMHLDNVRLPSWQAQLKGTKEWLIAPTPECLFECHSFSVIVNPGDVIVLDTNKWYHKTNVLSEEISIVIGAEYD